MLTYSWGPGLPDYCSVISDTRDQEAAEQSFGLDLQVSSVGETQTVVSESKQFRYTEGQAEPLLIFTPSACSQLSKCLQSCDETYSHICGGNHGAWPHW